jgi:electron transfer flavoprotein alpha subunit
MHHGVWVLGEERGGVIHPVSYEMLAWGRDLADALGEELTCLIMGAQARNGAQELVYHGADTVRVVADPGLAVFRVDPFARIAARLIEEQRPAILLASATTMGRTLMPVLAARLHLGLTADCTGLEIDPSDRSLVQIRPAIGGNVMAMIKTPERRPQMATVRPRSRHPSHRDAMHKGEIVEELVIPGELESRVRRLSFDPDTTSEMPIQEAEVVVAGGRGMKDARGYRLVISLARCLRGAVGASRVAVDQGWIPYSHQVGLSGKSVAPKLYIALGISGSANHLAGMSSSEVVVVVNKDPEATIFKVANLGIVGDVAEIVPALLARLECSDTTMAAKEGRE